MRTHVELIAEIARRKALGLPRIELTPQERARAFGDSEWRRNASDYDLVLAHRLQNNMPMSKQDRERARKFLRSQNNI